MRNFFNTVRKSGPLKTRDSFMVKANMVDELGQLTLWKLMNAMDEMKAGRIDSLKLNPEFEEVVHNMDMTFFETATVGDNITIESCFVQNGKRQVDLKVYVSKQTPGMPAKRVCRAIYTLSLQRTPALT